MNDFNLISRKYKLIVIAKRIVLFLEKGIWQLKVFEIFLTSMNEKAAINTSLTLGSFTYY